MADDGKVRCATHGLQDRAQVCRHIADSMLSGIPVGFHWPAAFVGPHADAWCTECERARIDAGGEWVPELKDQLSIKVLCGSCYEYAKGIWDAERKVNQ